MKLPSQDALIILRSSLGAPKVQHLLRSSTEVNHPEITRFDSLQRAALSSVVNADLSDNNWMQSSLPIREGGLGLRSACDAATPSFLASMFSTLPLQDSILTNRPAPSHTEVSHIIDKWSMTYGSPPSGTNATKQSEWMKPITSKSKAACVSSLTNERELATFRAAEMRHSGDWLLTLPISSCGLRLEDDAVRIAVALRLGLNICLPHQCKCGSEVDAFGSHAFICKHASGKGARHAAINDIIARTLTTSGTPITREPTGLIRGVGKRPDGLTLVPWRLGKSLAWDATISTPLAASYVAASARNAGSSAEAAELKKNAKYAYLSQGISFQAVALDSLGGSSQTTTSFINDLGRRLTAITSEPKETAFLWQRISICLTRFNSVLISESFKENSSDRDE